MKNRTCCFTGHRRLSAEETKDVKVKLKHTITEMIEAGYLYFGAGGALGFDTISALTVLKLKNEYPKIKLILVLPCVNQTRRWNKKDIMVSYTSNQSVIRLFILHKNTQMVVC